MTLCFVGEGAVKVAVCCGLSRAASRQPPIRLIVPRRLAAGLSALRLNVLVLGLASKLVPRLKALTESSTTILHPYSPEYRLGFHPNSVDTIFHISGSLDCYLPEYLEMHQQPSDY